MAHWQEAAVTNAGTEMLNEWMAGRKLTVTAAYGGTGTVDPDTLKEQTGLVDLRQRLSLMGQEDDKTGVLVQVQVNNTGISEEYELNQVMVMAALDRDKDPDSEEKCLFIMQDEKGVDVPAEDGEIFLLELYCAIGITNNGRFIVTVDSTGLVSMSRMKESIEKAVAEHNADPDAHGGGTGGASAAVLSVTVPAAGWVQNAEADERLDELHADIEVDGLPESSIPWLAVHPAGMETARRCGMSSTVRTLDGILRVYAKSAPEGDIQASLILLGASTGTIPGGSGSQLPASKTRLGPIKVGDGLSVADDGTLSVNQQTVVTSEDLVDEDEVAKAVASILK